MNNKNTIILSSDDFEKLVDRLVSYIKENHDTNNEWITTEHAMRLLNITSATTLQKLRNEGAITYTMPMRKNILYSKKSILDYLNKHTKHSF